uniref:Uncharacterized protein n=1 Tax=Tanacetum cinerariifolium TaxID=118510 RepID=A0A699HWM9_TANCI|nr:hypothetical protein [Tanacetum cinerariifolium]
MNNVHNTFEDKTKESYNELLNMLKLFCKNILRQHEHAANLSINIIEPSRRLNSFCYDDDDNDDEEKTIPLNDIVSQLPLFIDLVPIPSESEDTPESDSGCVLPSCNDFSPINIFEEKAVLEDIECKDSYDSNLDESTFLVTHLLDSNEYEYFTPGDDVELLLHHDPSTPKMSVVSIFEGFTDGPPLKENDYLFDLEYKNNEWKKILYDAPIDDLMTEDKVLTPGFMTNFFLQHM